MEAMIDIYNQNKTNLLSGIIIEDFVDLKIEGTRSKWGMNIR
jgi:phage gp46-like protein